MPIPIEILDINAVVVLNGMPKSPITPKLIAAVIIMGTVPVNPATTFLNIKLNNTATMTNDMSKLAI